MKKLLFILSLLASSSASAADYTGAFTGAQVDTGISYATLAQTQGSDILSASTINLDTATGYLVDVTGTTPITAITLGQGKHRTLRFTGILTFTNSSSLVIQGGASKTTAAGDMADCYGYAAGVVRCTYLPLSGASNDPLAVTGVRKVVATGQTAAFTMTLPAGAIINWIVFKNTTTNVVTGGMKVGVTLGGTEVVNAVAVGNSVYVTAFPLVRSVSLASPATLYFDAVSAWNSANLNVTILYTQP